MRLVQRVAFCAMVTSACHGDNSLSFPPPASRWPAPCQGTVTKGMSVDEALAVSERRDFVAVEGYLVLVSGPCTLMSCPEQHPNCNTCESYVRIAASRAIPPSTIELISARTDYRCLSNARTPCGAYAQGQHVLVQAALHYSENDFERVSLYEPEICELSP